MIIIYCVYYGMVLTNDERGCRYTWPCVYSQFTAMAIISESGLTSWFDPTEAFILLEVVSIYLRFIMTTCNGNGFAHDVIFNMAKILLHAAHLQ